VITLGQVLAALKYFVSPKFPFVVRLLPAIGVLLGVIFGPKVA